MRLIVLLAVALALVGCGGDSNDSGGTDETQIRNALGGFDGQIEDVVVGPDKQVQVKINDKGRENAEGMCDVLRSLGDYGPNTVELDGMTEEVCP